MSVTQFTAEERHALENKALWPRLICLPAAVVGINLLRRGVFVDDWLIQSLLTCLTAYALFCWTSAFHECAHQTLTGRAWFDIGLGRLLGTIMLTPYTVYRESHIRHHAYLNKPNDWELWPYADPQCSVGFRRVFVWFDLFLGVLTSPFIYGRIFFHHDSPLKTPAVRRAVKLEYAAIVLGWGSLYAWVGYSDAWDVIARCWLLPWWMAGVIQTGRKLTEHLGMPSYDPLYGTRTVLGSSWLTRFLTYCNFDIFIHGPHHRHPRVAHNELRGKMEEYLSQANGATYPVYRSYWRASLAMLPHLVANPGCGINAGAEPPHVARQGEVVDFVGDVSTEVLAAEDVGKRTADVQANDAGVAAGAA